MEHTAYPTIGEASALDLQQLPEVFRPLLAGPVRDSSCSALARVYYFEKENCYLKTAPKDSLKTEAEMARFFHRKGLGPRVLDYVRTDCDWLLTEKIPGADGCHPDHLARPEQLCDTFASLLRQLHETDFSGCPVPNRTESYLAAVRENDRAGRYDPTLLPPDHGFSSREEARQLVQTQGHLLCTDTLLHGDYCLPNILLQDWHFSGFIDLGNGGVGDRHIDLFWGAWTLLYNLKDRRYCRRFLDAYGRDRVEPELLRLVAACEVFG